MSNSRPTSNPKAAASSKGGGAKSGQSGAAARGGSSPARAVKPAVPPRPPVVVKRKQPAPEPEMTSWVEDVGLFLGRYWQELAAMTAIVVGAILLMTLYSGGDGYPGVVSVAWARRIFGWTAPWVGVVLVLSGVLGLMGARAGYWSVEALVGAELLLLALATFSSLSQMELVDWAPPSDGSAGGVVGWAMATLLVVGLGRTLALLVVVGTAVAGILLLVRYTPLIYLLAALTRAFGALRARLAVRTAALPPAAGWAPRSWSGGGGARAEREAAVKFVSPEAPSAAAPARSPAPPAAPAQVQPDNLPAFLRRSPAPTAAPAAPAPAAPAAKRGARAPKGEAAPAPLPQVQPTVLPALELLKPDGAHDAQNDVHQQAARIKEVLGELGVPVEVVHVESGPTVTQFGVAPQYIIRNGEQRKVRVSQITALADDLALALATPSVRMEAPVAGRNYVGIEIPNRATSLVTLRGIVESAEFARHGGALALPLGRNTTNAPVVMDLTRAPHMLIAGATGSGKSVCINTIVTGLLLRHGPDSLRMVMVDPKRVELAGYAGIPHLMGPVITDVDRVMPALTWLTLQMDDRYVLFREVGARNIDGYNAWVRAQPPGEGAPQPLPYLLLIVDELADLMMTAPEDVERQLCRLAQKARATGIHLILATQRPSVDVVTGLIKANFPTRIAFAVTSQIDSRVILDTPGAERLLGRGDMLLMRPDAAKSQRVQGCLVTDDEIGRVVAFWRKQAAAANAGAAQGSLAREPWADLIGRDEEVDELTANAIEALMGQRVASVSFLQRRLRIGYPRAARLMEQLEEKGIVGPDSGGSQGREVLLKSEAETEAAAVLVADWPVAKG